MKFLVVFVSGKRLIVDVDNVAGEAAAARRAARKAHRSLPGETPQVVRGGGRRKYPPALEQSR